MKIGTTRVETFSDGVIAIIITIMVLTIKIPDISKVDTPWEIRNYLKLIIPNIGVYAFSYMMIGIFWVNHHHMFHLLEKTDEPLLLQNLLFLFWMSLIPVATAVIKSNLTFSDSVAFYGFVMLMTTLTLAIMRWYTLKKDLVHKDNNVQVDGTIKKVSLRARTKSFIGAVSYLASLGFAFINVYVSYACLIIPPIIFFVPDGIDDEKLANKIEGKNMKVGKE